MSVDIHFKNAINYSTYYNNKENNMAKINDAEKEKVVKKPATKTTKAKQQEKPQEVQQEQKPESLVNLNSKDGVSVAENKEKGVYVITMPNYYDATYDLAGRNKFGEIKGYVDSEDKNQKVKNVVIEVPFDKITDKKVADDLNRKVSHARGTMNEIKQEIDTMETVIAFAAGGKEYLSNGIPKTAMKDEQGNVIKKDGKTQFQNGGWFKGELVSVGKYFVVARDNNPNIPQDKMVFRKLETNKMLEFAKGDYEKPRFEAVKEKLGLTDADFQADGGIKPGIEKFFAYDEKGRAEKISSTYVKKQAQTQQQNKSKENSDEAALSR